MYSKGGVTLSDQQVLKGYEGWFKVNSSAFDLYDLFVVVVNHILFVGVI